MLCIFMANVFDPKIVNSEATSYGSGLVFPEPWHVLTLDVAVFVESLFMEFVGKETALGESIHSLMTNMWIIGTLRL